MDTRTITILQHMLQNCYCACDHFTLSGVKVLTLHIIRGQENASQDHILFVKLQYELFIGYLKYHIKPVQS